MGTFCLPSDQKDMLSARQQYCQHFADSDCSIKNRLATSRPCHFSTTTNMGGVKGSRSTITGMRVMLFFALAYLAICGASVNAAPSTGQPSSKGGSRKASGNNENGVIPSHTTNRVPMDSPMQQTEAGRPKPVQTPNSQRAPTRAGKSTKRLDVAVIIVMRVFSMYSTRYQRQCAAPNCARSALAYHTYHLELQVSSPNTKIVKVVLHACVSTEKMKSLFEALPCCMFRQGCVLHTTIIIDYRQA